MNPEIWGPGFWIILHSISINYPDKPTYIDKQQHLLFFQSLKQVLPCQKCRTHYTEYLNKNPISPYLDNKDNLILWVLNCHNNVNKINSKKLYSLDEMKQFYNNVYSNSDKFKFKLINKNDIKELDTKKKKINYHLILNIVFIILFIILFLIYIFIPINKTSNQ